MPPEAVIFDVDGLLIDSEPLWEQTERRVFAKVGVDLSAEDCQQTTGLRTDEVVRYWFERQPWVDVSPGEVETWILDGMVEAIAAHGSPLPGAVAALQIASRLDVPIAVASSSPPQLIDASLQRLGVSGMFATTASAYDEPFGKPDPGVYLTVARQLDVDPTRCVALEDSPNGVRSAKAAGMRCIAVPTSAHRATIAPLADVVLASLGDLTTQHLNSGR